MFLKYISLPIFLVSFAVGLFFVYIHGSDLKPIYIYPTPENMRNVLFKDNAGNCFTYKSMEVDCTENVKEIPVQM